MAKAIVIGASSGIGEALARVLARNGYEVGLAARRGELLERLAGELETKSYIKIIDVTQFTEAMVRLEELIREMGDVDLIVINSGVGHKSDKLEFESQKKTIDVNVSGFVAMAVVAYNYFLARKMGHIVGISSIAAVRGSGGSPSYNASKAFEYNYMQGLRSRAWHNKVPIAITAIQPGYVRTPMLEGAKDLFWEASADEAAGQIFDAIRKKRKQAYITRRWRLIAWLMRVAPDWMYFRVR